MSEKKASEPRTRLQLQRRVMSLGYRIWAMKDEGAGTAVQDASGSNLTCRGSVESCPRGPSES